jgi:hypothetical protein
MLKYFAKGDKFIESASWLSANLNFLALAGVKNPDKPAPARGAAPIVKIFLALQARRTPSGDDTGHALNPAQSSGCCTTARSA